MRGNVNYTRCGQCGRSYTKAQWRRNEFWCSKCGKFVCYDCVSRGYICPACGTKVTNWTGALFVVGIGIGLIVLPIILLGSLIEPPETLREWYLIAFMSSFPVVMFLSGLSSFIIKKKRVRRHLKYLSDMPSGIIPIQNRPGFDDVFARQRWREANIKRSERNAPANKGTFPMGAFDGLVGDWNYPILSKEEMLEYTVKSQRRLSYFFAGLIILGIISLILAFYLDMDYNCALFGILSILTGSLFIGLSRYSLKRLEKDIHHNTTATWKKVGYRTADWAIEEFLKLKGIRYRREVTEWTRKMYNHPEFKYTLDNGNYITSLYSESGDGHIYRWITIGYKSSNYIQAKELQLDLDEFLAKRDLIRRVA